MPVASRDEEPSERRHWNVAVLVFAILVAVIIAPPLFPGLGVIHICFPISAWELYVYNARSAEHTLWYRPTAPGPGFSRETKGLSLGTSYSACSVRVGNSVYEIVRIGGTCEPRRPGPLSANSPRTHSQDTPPAPAEPSHQETIPMPRRAFAKPVVLLTVLVVGFSSLVVPLIVCSRRPPSARYLPPTGAFRLVVGEGEGEFRVVKTAMPGIGQEWQGEALRHADWEHANLQQSTLIDCDLRDADLRQADLRGAILRGSDLRAANLAGADLRGSDLTGACLDCRRWPRRLLSPVRSPANLQGARYDRQTRWPAGFRPEEHGARLVE
jgi:Pentapeptide repeats (8 copies)